MLSCEAAFILVFSLWDFFGGVMVYIFFEYPQLCQIFKGAVYKCEINKDRNIYQIRAVFT